MRGCVGGPRFQIFFSVSKKRVKRWKTATGSQLSPPDCCSSACNGRPYHGSVERADMAIAMLMRANERLSRARLMPAMVRMWYTVEWTGASRKARGYARGVGGGLARVSLLDR